MKKYCKHCGAKTIKVSTNKFDEQTGKPVFDYVCPTGKCFHTGMDTYSLTEVGNCRKCGAKGHTTLD